MARSCFEDFVIEGKLGSGSFGTVFKVTRKADGQQYALKEIDLRCMSEQEQEDCIKECSVLASLDSPHIIKFYDSFLQKGKLYICMEYASGGNLYDYVRQQEKELPEERVWQLFIQMLVGLNYMHGRKILHRDFKTPNVFLDDKLNVRLGDLGVAKVLSDQTLHARTMIGTPYYLSPEICEDKPYDSKSDVWALGVGLYECCARKHPFDSENQGNLILKILRGKYPPLTGYSKELTDIVKGCLTLDPDNRPGTNTLLALKSVRQHAKDLDIKLPPLPSSKAASPSPPPSKTPSRPALSGRSFQSRQARDSESAAAGAGVPSRSPTPPLMQRSPSARMPAAIARVDIAADLVFGPTAAAGMGGKAAAAAGAGRRHTTTDEAPGALQGQVEKQLQGMKLSPAGPCSQRSSASSIPIAISPEPVAEAPGSSFAANSIGSSSRPDTARQGISSCDVTERSDRVQSLPTVKNQIIELVGPLVYDALRSMARAHAQAGNPLIHGQNSSSSSHVCDALASAHQQQQQSTLLAAMHHIVPSSQAAGVLPLLVRLLQLEAQAGSEKGLPEGLSCSSNGAARHRQLGCCCPMTDRVLPCDRQ